MRIAIMGAGSSVHVVLVTKEIDGVMTTQERFWIGYKIIDGEGKFVLPPEVEIPESLIFRLSGVFAIICSLAQDVIFKQYSFIASLF